MREKRSIPEATVGFVVTNSKRLSRLNAVGWKLCCEIILRVQQGSVLEVNRHWVAFQDFCCFLGSAGTLFLNDNLVDTNTWEGVGKGTRKKRKGYFMEPGLSSF